MGKLIIRKLDGQDRSRIGKKKNEKNCRQLFDSHNFRQSTADPAAADAVNVILLLFSTGNSPQLPRTREIKTASKRESKREWIASRVKSEKETAAAAAE